LWNKLINWGKWGSEYGDIIVVLVVNTLKGWGHFVEKKEIK